MSQRCKSPLYRPLPSQIGRIPHIDDEWDARVRDGLMRFHEDQVDLACDNDGHGFTAFPGEKDVQEMPATLGDSGCEKSDDLLHEALRELNRLEEREALYAGQHSEIAIADGFCEPNSLESLDNEPPAGSGHQTSHRKAPKPGMHWDRLIEHFQLFKPGRRGEMYLDWMRKQRAMSISRSQAKFEVEGAYRERRKEKREAGKVATYKKEQAQKLDEYHARQLANGKKTRRNQDLSKMSLEQIAEHTRQQQNNRQRRSRKIRNILKNARQKNPATPLHDLVSLLEQENIEPPHPLEKWTQTAVWDILVKAKL